MKAKKQNNSGPYRGASMSVLVAALGGIGCAQAQTMGEPATAPLAAGDDTATVVVTGMRASLQSARNKKRDNDAIGDSIVADDIGKLPDQNIAEAAQRIPGVQLQRYKEEGAGIAIRGLADTKTVLNGLEVYGASGHAGEYNSRNFDLEDLPTEVLAGVDVAKSSSAHEIEGGLGGYVNIRTRQPFDFKGRQAVLSLKATAFDMASGFETKVRGQGSLLLSDRWKTAFGEVGVLLNVAHTESVYGMAESEVQRTEPVSNFAGSGKTVTQPIGIFTGNGHHGDRKRDTYLASVQWRPSASLSLDANYIGIDYMLRNAFQTARLYTGTPTAAYTLWGDRNADGSDNLKSGTFSANTMNSTSVVADEGRKSKLADIGGKWSDGGALTVKARLSRNRTAVVNTLYEWGINATNPLMTLTMNEGAASRVSVAGTDLTNPANFRPAYLLSLHLDGTQTNTAGTVDANYKFDSGIVNSIDFGLRRSNYTRHSFGFVNFACIDGCNGSRTLAQIDPSLLRQVPAAESRDIGAYTTFSTAAVREQAALRALYGINQAEPNNKDQDQLNNEKTSALYMKLNYELDLAGKPFTGNLGMRYIQTRLHGEAYGADASGALVLQGKDSKRNDALPSFNGSLALSDGLNLRVAASKTLGQINFGVLRAAVNIGNPVQRDASAGNPDLKPYTSKNFDLSLERYFGRTGMAYLAAFGKKVDGFIQSTNEKRIINGEEYNVSTFKSAGISRIKGLEAGYQQFFDQLPAPFDGLGVQANYTYVDSEAATSAPVAGKRPPLQGLSKNSYNLVGMYEKGRFKSRLAYNYRGGYVSSASSSAALGAPIYAHAMGTLDFSVSYDISKQLTVVVDGVNIAGASGEGYFGNPHSQFNYMPMNKRYGVQLRYAL